jgi:hypothetical protein
MGRKKTKKISAKKEKYAKFHKEKSGTLDLAMPDLSAEEQKAKQDDEMKINKFLRFRVRNEERAVRERLLKDKR